MGFKVWLALLGKAFGLLAVFALLRNSPTPSAGVGDSAGSLDVSATVQAAAHNAPSKPKIPAVLASAPEAVARSQVRPAYALAFRHGFLPFLADGGPAQISAEFHHVAVGDVTGDRRDDLISLGVTEDPGLGMLYVYPQSPIGRFDQPIRYPIDDGDAIVGLSLADMNSDDVDDVIITRAQGVEILLSSSDGSMIHRLNSTQDDGLGTSVPAVALDVDQDGAMDLVTHLSVTHAESSNMTIDRRSRFRVLYGNGEGGVSRIEDFGHFGVDTGDYGHYDHDAVTSFVADDLNNDGLVDLATVSRKFVFVEQRNPPFASIYWNLGNGQFSKPLEISLAGGVGGEYIGTGDFNGDGRTDFVLTDSFISLINVFHQQAAGHFTATPDYKRVTGRISVSVNGVDLDGDGKRDLLIGHSNWGSLSHYLQRNGVLGEGIFTGLSGFAGIRLDGSISTSGVATGDLDSDGCTDVAVAASYNGLQVFTGSNCVPARQTGGRQPRRRRP